MASLSAFRTRTSPSGPSKLETISAPLAYDGPCVTVSLGLELSCSNASIGPMYEPSMSPASSAAVSADSSGTPTKSIAPTLGTPFQYEALRTTEIRLPTFQDFSSNGPVHITPPSAVPYFAPWDSANALEITT